MATLGNVALEADLREALGKAVADFVAANPKSRTEDERAAGSMPGGNTRTVLFHPPFPLTIERGEGQYVRDIDGHSYTDFVGEFGAGLFGHSNPQIVEAMTRAIGDGVVLGGPNRYERILAAELVNRFPSLDKVRFTNSGTEANMMAIATARVVSGKSKVMVFAGSYHGGVFMFAHGGSPVNAPFDYVMAPFNRTDETVSLVAQHAGDLACVVIEPMQGAGGMIPADKDFLQALRDVTARHDIILIFDEVVTSRLSGGGRQKLLGITPDMTTLGKYIGGGATFGAFGGREDIMNRYDPRSENPIEHPGTFNNNVITHAAGSTGMTQIYTPGKADSFNAWGQAFRDGLNETIRKHSLPLHVSGLGSIMQLHCCEGPLKDVHDSEKGNRLKSGLVFYDLLARGQRMTWRNSMLLCLPMTDEDLDGYVAAFDDVLSSRSHLLAAE
ncbi:MAG: aminotransferase class III-fold pyridoxal phosphate-dependent enzyme [Rhodospirillales bacterium]|nr:aminotransferase class III-fold pyridoxal phosphate-dependent enzyme [Rhodospirillales bacterium]